MIKKIFSYTIGILVCCFLIGFSQAIAITIMDDFSSDPTTNWQLNGNAKWNGDQAQVDLTNDVWQRGSMWYNQSFDLSKYKSFIAEFDFSVGSKDQGADGITFAVIDKSNGLNALGRGGGDLGYGGISNSFAVEFDTYRNLGYDPSDNHIGIDKNGNLSSLKTLTVENIETSGFKHAKIKFDIPTGALSVYLDKDKDGNVDYTLDYTITDFTPFEAYFGFTGATGSCYNLQSVDNFNLTLNPVPIPSSMLLLLSGLIGGFYVKTKEKIK